MKRITYWPQLFLGITFNWGIFVVGASLDQFPPSLFLLYASGVLWTLGYDTIYGFQDIEDDLKIGIKSTAILSQKYPKLFIGGCYLGSIIMLAAIGLYNQDNFIFLMGTSFFGAMLLKQLYSLNIQNPRECLASFKQGVYIGLIPWIAIILTN
jgi:4-hydroxybenzoate polyprenyltransferase